MLRLFVQRCSVLLVVVRVVVVVVIVDEVDVDVDVLVDVDVDVVVVSQLAQVLSHWLLTNASEHKPPANKRSQVDKGKTLALPAHLCNVDVVEVLVEVLVLLDVDVEVDVLVELLVDVDVDVDVEVDVDVVVPHAPSLSASFSGSTGQGSSLPQIPSLSTSFSGSAAHVSKHSDSHAQGHIWHMECAMHLPSLLPPST